MTQAEAFLVVHEIDEGEKPVTDWEAGLLNTILEYEVQRRTITIKQMHVIEKMEERYLR